MGIYNPGIIFADRQTLINIVPAIKGILILKVTITFLLICISGSLFAQELVGAWKWENREYESKVYFTWRQYFVETYLAGTNSKVRETYLNYEINNDTIVFSEAEEINEFAITSKYVIKKLTDSLLVLENLDIGATDIYTRLNNDMPEIVKYKFDEFYYSGGGIACISDRELDNYHNCLNFKMISIESSQADVERLLGKPYNILEHLEKTYHVYVLEDVDNTEAYVAVNYDNGRIASLQMTGLYTMEDLSFSSIRLGDYYTMVINRLGEPSKRERIDDNIELWDYAPFSFSFEIRNNLVYSVKLIRL